MTDAIIVIDVPEDMPAEEASRILNAPGDSYFLVTVLPACTGHRAYLRRYKQTPPSSDVSRGRQWAPVGGNTANKDGRDAEAYAIIAANKDEKVPALVKMLEDEGITRKKTWVTLARIKARGTGTHRSSG